MSKRLKWFSSKVDPYMRQADWRAKRVSLIIQSWFQSTNTSGQLKLREQAEPRISDEPLYKRLFVAGAGLLFVTNNKEITWGMELAAGSSTSGGSVYNQCKSPGLSTDKFGGQTSLQNDNEAATESHSWMWQREMNEAREGEIKPLQHTC